MSSALVISRYFPFDPRRVHAVYQRLGTQVQALARVVDVVECLFLVPPDQQRTSEELAEHERQLRALWSAPLSLRLAAVANEQEPQGAWQRFGRGIFDFNAHGIARPLANEAAVNAVRAALVSRPDVILAHRLSAVCVLLRRAVKTNAPIFFDMDDIEHVAWSRRLWRDPAWPNERWQLLHVPRLLLAEAQAARRAAATFVCSEADRRYLARFAGPGRVEVIPNSVPFPPVPTEDATEPLVLFVGSMGSRPNAQAADVLVQSIWPRVREHVPEARLAIIGQGAEFTASYPPRDPSVSFLGFVDDLGSWYHRARLLCCPIYHGSGTRVKIIEAAAYAKAVVSTHLGAEGLRFAAEREILLRDQPADLADACVALLRDPAAAAKLGRAARERAATLYDRDAVVCRLEAIFRDTAARHRARHGAG
jgi:glycosyltransferase involved in cell wall biosynthesis